jgi:serine/threonine protein kinase
MHRDIKPSNIIYADDVSETDVVLIDMGFSTSTKSIRNNYIRCGSPGYVAPEIL